MKDSIHQEIFKDSEKSIDLKAFLFDFVIRWPLILASLILFLTGAYIYLRYQTPVYSISSTVLIKQGDKTKSSSINQLASMQDLGTVSLANNFDNEIEILQSYSLIQKVVERLNLYVSYNQEQKYAYDIPVYDNTPVKVWMSPHEAENLPSVLQVHIEKQPEGDYEITATFTENGTPKEIKKNYQKLPSVFITPVGSLSLTPNKNIRKSEAPYSLTATITPPSITASYYQAHLSATPTSDYTSIVRLTIKDSNVQRGQDFLNTLVEIYNDDANEDKNQVAQHTAQFIDERIAVINEELGATETELADYKQRAGIIDLNANAQRALEGSSEYEQKRAENTNQLRLVDDLRKYLENSVNKDEVIPANVGFTDNGLINIINQYNEMIVQRKRLLRSSKETSPAVISLDEAIATTRTTVLATVENVERSLRITRNNLDWEAGKFRSRISNSPRQEQELRNISRQQEIKAQLYLMLLQKREENAITLAAKANNGRMVESPRLSGWVSPNARNLYLIALALGLGLPIGGIWIARYFRFKIEGRSDVERITNVSIAGDIPLAQKDENNPIVISENRNEIMEEVFRSLRTNLQYLLQEDQKVILFTSSTSGEGKSFCASNLATSLAFMEKKTLVVGLDIRRPSLARIFSLDKTAPGITQYLAAPSSTDLLNLCQPTTVSSNLYVLPNGAIPPNPTELVARKSLDTAIEILKQHFDYIILDTAPIGLVTDTQLIARVADLCVFVCRADYTRKSEFAQINEVKQDKNIANMCVLINGINMDKRKNGYYYGYGKYGKYGKYGYGRKYKYGYGK